MMDREWQLKLASGKTVVWNGSDGESAAKRYVDMHPDETVIAFRSWPRHGVFPHADTKRITD